MSKFTPFTYEQIKAGIIAPFIKILAFALSFIEDKELVKTIIAETAESVGKLAEEIQTPTLEEAVYSGIEIGQAIADHTETQADDLALDAAQVGADFVFKRGVGWSKIIALFRLRKKVKAEQAAEETEKKE